LCKKDCTCGEPEGPPPYNVYDFLFNQKLANNILHNKILFMLRVVKDALIQLELKTLEAHIASVSCEDAIFSLTLTKNDFIYAKEEEFTAMVKALINVIDENPEKYPDIDTETAETYVYFSEDWNEMQQYAKARACICKAYKILNDQTDPIVCEAPEI
jgi:hypothetical protein